MRSIFFGMFRDPEVVRVCGAQGVSCMLDKRGEEGEGARRGLLDARGEGVEAREDGARGEYR